MITFQQLVQKTQQLFIETSDNINIKQVGDTWTDDHITCATFNINGIDIVFTCCGDDIVGAVRYSHESPQAKKDAIDMVVQVIEQMLEEQDDDQMEFLKLYGITLDTFNDVNYD